MLSSRAARNHKLAEQAGQGQGVGRELPADVSRRAARGKWQIEHSGGARPV